MLCKGVLRLLSEEDCYLRRCGQGQNQSLTSLATVTMNHQLPLRLLLAVRGVCVVRRRSAGVQEWRNGAGAEDRVEGPAGNRVF